MFSSNAILILTIYYLPNTKQKLKRTAKRLSIIRTVECVIHHQRLPLLCAVRAAPAVAGSSHGVGHLKILTTSTCTTTTVNTARVTVSAGC